MSCKLPLLVLWLLTITCWLPGCRSSGPEMQPVLPPAGGHFAGWVFQDSNGVPGVWMDLGTFLYYEDCRIWRLTYESQ